MTITLPALKKVEIGTKIIENITKTEIEVRMPKAAAKKPKSVTDKIAGIWDDMVDDGQTTAYTFILTKQMPDTTPGAARQHILDAVAVMDESGKKKTLRGMRSILRGNAAFSTNDNGVFFPWLVI